MKSAAAPLPDSGAANSVEVSAEEVPLPDWAPALSRYLEKALDALGKSGWSVSVLLAGDSFIRDLNRRYRGIDEPTDVLSFSLQDPEPGGNGAAKKSPSPGKRRRAPPYLAGDIIISLETLVKNAEYFGVAPGEELRRIAIHGILHLCGMDHATNEADEPMLELQEKLLNELDDGDALPDSTLKTDALAAPEENPGNRR